MAKINWQLGTIQDIAKGLANDINVLSDGLLRQQINYYRCTNNEFMVVKITKVKQWLKLYRLEIEVEKMKARLDVE